MTEDYIKDNGKVRLCTSNVAKMNLFESMYYHRFRMLKNIVDAINELKDSWHVIVNIFIVFILPIAYPIMAWWEIKRARKEMKRHEADES